MNSLLHEQCIMALNFRFFVIVNYLLRAETYHLKTVIFINMNEMEQRSFHFSNDPKDLYTPKFHTHIPLHNADF